MNLSNRKKDGEITLETSKRERESMAIESERESSIIYSNIN